MSVPKLRVARASDDLDRLLRFYVDGLGLELLYRFEDHEGFDGVMVGSAQAPWHLEFTRHRGTPAPPPPGPDSLLVLYLPEPGAFDARVARLRGAGFEPVAAFNPYWDRHGMTFEDPDGFRLVLCRMPWNA
jgi:catechol 2,3-dioxygenase-like lactoylglutathione lyase family enzyme